jgi:beta-xylosidase
MLLPLLLRRGTGALALATAFFACEGDPTTSPGAYQPAAEVPRGTPVHPGDFADPFVLVADSVYYAYATNRMMINVPVRRSTDLSTWTAMGDAMPVLPAWAQSGKRLTWAPAVLAAGDHFVLLYTARHRASGLQCVGRAESVSPLGPFVDRSSGPFICQVDLGGSIDASVVRDLDGGTHVLWKNDGNCCGKPVALWSQRLSQDARSMIGVPVRLLDRDQVWEGPLIEAPTMWRENGTWHLLYSANMWNTDQYAIGYSACESPLGPCRKIGNGPVVASDTATAGPGGAEVFTDRGGQRWMVYHGWSVQAVGYKNGGVRAMRLAPMFLGRGDAAGTRMLAF